MYNVAAKNSRGGCFRFSHDNNVWQLSQGQYNHFRGSPSPHHPKKLPSFQLSRNTSQTTTTQTPTPSTSSLSIISSRVGSSLTTGIMEQVSTWRTGADTDDDDEASLEIYSNPPLNRGSYPSQESRDSSNLSGGSLLNGMDILPTLHQLQFPQHPLEHPDDQDLYRTYPNQQYSNVMPPPSSTVSSFRRHSLSSHRASSSRPNRQNLDESGGDQFVPGSGRPNFHLATAEILARGVRQLESTSKSGGIAAVSDREQGNNTNNHSNNNSGFPSPQTTVPSPGIQPIPTFVQPSHQGSSRGESDSHNRQTSGQSGHRPLSSPNHNESTHQRTLSRRSIGDVEDLHDEDEPMLRPEPVRPKFKYPSRIVKEDPRLRDLGASLQKSLSFNGDDEYQSVLDEEELRDRDHRHSSLQPPRGRHHPYLPRPLRDEFSGRGGPSGQTRGQIEANFRRKGKGRAFDPHDDDLQLISKTPVLLSAINASQTNILSELQNVQRQNERDLVHFRNELYGSLQVAFSTLADQVGSVGKAVSESEANQKESIQQLGASIGSAMGEVFAKMTETLQQSQWQQQQQPFIQRHQQQQIPIRQTSPFVGGSLPNSLSGPFSHAFSTAGSVSGGQSSNWRRNDYAIPREEEEDEEDDHGRGKRRAVERPLSSSGNRRTINRPRREFDEKH